LQYNAADELKDFPQVVDLGNIDDPALRFVETAGVMKHLDLLIACDSGVAHVAGSLGLKTYMLISLAAYDARWGLKMATPWYPRHLLLRQKPAGDLRDWNEVVWDVRDVLESDIRRGVYR
jgi:ADP-heptose:LPS heptosyltransferase